MNCPNCESQIPDDFESMGDNKSIVCTHCGNVFEIEIDEHNQPVIFKTGDNIYEDADLVGDYDDEPDDREDEEDLHNANEDGL